MKCIIGLIIDDTIMLPTENKSSILEVVDTQNNNICC